MSAKIATKQTVEASDRPKDEPSVLVAFIHDMLLELHRMAPPEAGPMLPYVIDMARLEAEESRERLAAPDF